MNRFCFVSLLLLASLSASAQLSPLEPAHTAGKVTYYRYLVPHSLEDATQTVPIDVSRASSFSIVLATGTTVGGVMGATRTVTIQASLVSNVTPFSVINNATGTALWAALPVTVGSATETLTHYGMKSYETGGAVQARASVNEHNKGLILQFAIKED